MYESKELHRVWFSSSGLQSSHLPILLSSGNVFIVFYTKMWSEKLQESSIPLTQAAVWSNFLQTYTFLLWRPTRLLECCLSIWFLAIHQHKNDPFIGAESPVVSRESNVYFCLIACTPHGKRSDMSLHTTDLISYWFSDEHPSSLLETNA